MKTTKIYLEIGIDIEYEYTPAEKGKYNGLPENCYPGEPEIIDLVSVYFGDSDILGALEKQDIESIKKQISQIENRRD